MAITVVQSVVVNNPAGSGTTATFSSPVTIGNKLICCTGQRDQDATQSVTGFTLTRHENNAGWPDAFIYYRDATATTQGWNVSSSSRARFIFLEVAGLAPGQAGAVGGVNQSGTGHATMSSLGFIIAATAFTGNEAGTAPVNGCTMVGFGQCADSLPPWVSAAYKVSLGSTQTGVQPASVAANSVALATWAEAPTGVGMQVI